jgi:uncharacterized protein (TIGR03437 family)
MKRIANALGKFSWGKRAFAVLVLCATTVIALPAQTPTTVVTFNGTNGDEPQSSLVQDSDGNFYGTTAVGGAYSVGTVFKLTPSGTLTTLYSFCHQYAPCVDGAILYAGLIRASDGNFYGTTNQGGANSNAGTVFKISPGGTLTTLYRFCSQGSPCADGASPFAGLIQATDGNFYGTTAVGANGGGTVFKITPGGTLTTLYSFCSHVGCADGEWPKAGLIQASDGSFYGTTNQGGANGGGTVFKITPGGTLTTLYSFCSQAGCTDGAAPLAGLIQASDGNFYGTTSSGGAIALSAIPTGTVFKITPGGTLTTLYCFCSQAGCADGEAPVAALVQASDGNLYGTTEAGGANGGALLPESPGYGTVFKITSGGTLTTLYSFCSLAGCADGEELLAGLIQATDGNLYGTTVFGGAVNGAVCVGGYGCGTVFSLSVGLGPAVPAVNAGGVLNSGSYTTQGVAPGSIVSIFGTNLAASTAAASAIPLPTALGDVTSVTSNSIPAGLYFVSQNQINAQIPFNVLTSGQGSGTANVVVTRSNGTSAPQNVIAVPASPGIFTTTANGLGQAFAYDNTTGALAAPAGPAIGSLTTAPISVSSGHALIVACTGLGSVTPSIGNYVAASDGILRNTLLQPIVLIGGVQAHFVYSVPSPQFVSEYQIGVVPAPSTPTGDAVSLQIRIGGVTTTDQVTIAVAP